MVNDEQLGKHAALTETELYWLLEELSVKLGVFLAPGERAKLEASPPNDIQDFTRAVLRAEGLDPDTCARQNYREVHRVVSAAFARAAARRRTSHSSGT